MPNEVINVTEKAAEAVVKNSDTIIKFVEGFAAGLATGVGGTIGFQKIQQAIKAHNAKKGDKGVVTVKESEIEVEKTNK